MSVFEHDILGSDFFRKRPHGPRNILVFLESRPIPPPVNYPATSKKLANGIPVDESGFGLPRDRFGRESTHALHQEGYGAFTLHYADENFANQHSVTPTPFGQYVGYRTPPA